jgi:hypothetical protein
MIEGGLLKAATHPQKHKKSTEVRYSGPGATKKGMELRVHRPRATQKSIKLRYTGPAATKKCMKVPFIKGAGIGTDEALPCSYIYFPKRILN